MNTRIVRAASLALSTAFLGCGDPSESTVPAERPQAQSPAVDAVCERVVALESSTIEICRETYASLKQTWSRAVWTGFHECIHGIDNARGLELCLTIAESGKVPSESGDGVPDPQSGASIQTICREILLLAKKTDGPDMSAGECQEELGPTRAKLSESQWTGFQHCVEAATHWRDIDDCAIEIEDAARENRR